MNADTKYEWDLVRNLVLAVQLGIPEDLLLRDNEVLNLVFFNDTTAQVRAYEAFNDDMSAAKEVHACILEDRWPWTMTENGAVLRPKGRHAEDNDNIAWAAHENLGRAWLIAILRARLIELEGFK